MKILDLRPGGVRGVALNGLPTQIDNSGQRWIVFQIAVHWITLSLEGAAMTPAESRKSLLSMFFAAELRAWQGRMALPVVFWGYGVTASLALAMLHGTALGAGQLTFQQVLILISAAYTAWVLVAIWRCAPNSSLFWGMLARWLTVTWGLNTAFVLVFLQLELVLRYGWA